AGACVVNCRGCGEQFEPEFDRQRLCWSCWRARKDQDERLRREAEERLRGWRRRQYDERRYDPPPRDTPKPALSITTLRGAIALCHPDRHPVERQADANRVCAELLRVYAEIRDQEETA